MSGCGLPQDASVPVIHLKMIGRGENAMRMEKRLRCAGRAVGVRVDIDWQAEHYGDPMVYFNDTLFTDHLMDTEQIEQLLYPLLKDITHGDQQDESN